jgi:hypothetical protein
VIFRLVGAVETIKHTVLVLVFGAPIPCGTTPLTRFTFILSGTQLGNAANLLSIACTLSFPAPVVSTLIRFQGLDLGRKCR